MSTPAIPRLMRTVMAVVFALVVAGCGGGGAVEEDPPANRWDQMNWGEGHWS